MDNSLLINNYFKGTLTLSQQEKLSYLLENNPDFAKEFQFQKDVQKAFFLEKRSILKKELQNLEHFQPKKERETTKKWWLAVASIILLVGLGYFFSIANTITNDELFSMYFNPYENVVHPLTRGESAKELKDNAFSAYENKNYEKAIPLFNNAYKETKDYDLLLYKSISLLATEKTEDAIKTLTTYLSKNPKYVSHAKWYLALAYTKQKKNVKAKEELKELIKSFNFNKKEAKELLKKIK